MLITAGLQVPLIPLFDVPGSTGAVLPSQIGGMEENIGIKIGLASTIPKNRLVVHPFIAKEILEYKPAFNPVSTIWPDAFAVRDNGPMDTPSSV